MKKITLAEKIEKALVRVILTEGKIGMTENEMRHLHDALKEANEKLNKAFLGRGVYKIAEAALRRNSLEWQLERDLHDLTRYQKRLANQKAYLHKLQAVQAKIDAENAAEDAYIDAMITLAGAIA